MNQTPTPTELSIRLDAEYSAMLDELVPYLCQLTRGRITNRLEAAQWLIELAVRDTYREHRQVEIMGGAFTDLDEEPRSVLDKRS